MTKQTAQEWAAEYLQEDKAKRDNRNQESAWEQAIQEQAYLSLANEPQSLTGFYDTDPTKKTNSADRKFIQEGVRKKTEFVNAFEAAAAQHRNNIPREFLLQFQPWELRAFGDGTLVEEAKWLEDALAAQAFERDRQANVGAAWEAELEAQERRASFTDKFGLKPGEQMGSGEAYNVHNMISLGRFDELVEDDISAYMASERAMIEMIRAGHPKPTDQALSEDYLFPTTQTGDPSIQGDPERGAFEGDVTLGDGTNLSPDDFQRFWDQLYSGASTREKDLADFSDAEVEEFLQEREEYMRAQVRGAPDQVKDLLTPGRGQGFIDGAWEAVGTVVDKGLEFGGLLSEHARPLVLITPFDMANAASSVWGGADEAQAETIRQYKAETGLPDSDLLAQNLNIPANEAMASLEQENPEVAEEYLRMAGFDPTLALGFLQADLTAEISPDEQLQYLSELRLQEDEILKGLEDNDFQVGDEVLHWLAVWGRNVPGRLSTMYSILLTDEDFLHMAQDTGGGGFISTWNNVVELGRGLGEASAKYDHTPSVAMGIDGTAGGLLLDLGSGIAFDPTTWIFGPRLAGRSASAATVDAAEVLAKSRLTQRMARDVVDMAQSPSRGISSMYHSADWLDPISMGEFLNVIDVNPAVLPASPWRAVRGHNATEVQSSFLSKLIPDELRGAVDDVGIENLADDIMKNGFQEPVVVTLSRADNTLTVTNGSRRIMAAESRGISHIPMRLRVTDEIAGNTTPRLRGLTDDLARQIETNPDDFVYMGTSRSTGEQLNELAVEGFDRGGLANQVGRAEDYASGVRMTGADGKEIIFLRDDLTSLQGVDDINEALLDMAQKHAKQNKIKNPDIAVLEGKVTVFRKSELPDHLQEALKRGDIEEMEVLLQGEKIKPTGWYNLDEGPLPPQVQTSRSGVNLDNLLQEGDELAVPLKQAGRNEDVFVRPDSVLPRRMTNGDIDYDAVNEIFRRAIVERGMKPTGSQNAAIARGLSGGVRKLLRGNAPGRWIERYMTPQNVGTRLELAGVHAMDKIIDTMYRVWGDDTAKLNEWLEPIMNWQKTQAARSGEAARRLSALQPRMQRLRHMEDLVGDKWDEVLKTADDIEPQALANRQQLRQVVNAEDKALRRILAEIDAETGVVGATDDLERVVLAMFDDYNRSYIATNPAWKDLVDPETGMVPWDQLQKGKPRPPADGLADDTARFFSDDMAAAAEQMGIDAEDLAQKLSHSQNAKLATQMPLSPLELIMAREVGGAAYTRLTHWSVVNQVREGARTAHRLWIIDKVFTPATAATVSFDELLRMFHDGGIQSVLRWAGDRAIHTQARAHALIRGKGIKVRKGAEHLSAKKQERLRMLYDQPTYLKQAERQTFEQHGLGWTDIAPGDHMYDDAARQWTSGLLQDTGFRAMLRGRERFAEWFASPDGERLRNGVVMGTRKGKVETRLANAADEYYDGWKALYEEVILKEAKKAGKLEEVKGAWMRLADQIEESGGVPKDLPDVAINYLGPVRGVKRDLPNKLGVTRMQEGFFDRLFMDPVNYRRGFLADMTRTHEKSRLTSLFHTQGKRIVPDSEVEVMLGLKGMAGAQRTGLRPAIQEMALKSGIIPESFVDDLVEKAVLKEIDNTLYAFDKSSRMGSQSRAVFPFGKPWADMAGYWGREVIRKPVMRGWVNKTNFMGLRSANEAGLLSMPLVPNRSAAMLSRLAHTDFTLEDGLFGSEESDFSPLFFLPTKGENPFSYMIPGLGILPIAFLDYFMADRYDPISQAEEHQQLVDSVGQLIPSAHFQQGGLLSRALGGGTTARLGGLAVDLAGMVGNNSYFNLTSEMGDISREINRTREISALLAQPEELELLLAAETPQEAEALLQALAIDADIRASQAHFGEGLFRYMAPVAHKFSNAIAEIENVWLDAANFPELDWILEGRDTEDMTEEQRRQVANDIRTEFFRLEGWQRDALVVQQPSLAVNMVGSWEWTPEAINTNLPGSDYAYRTGGSKSDLAQHEAYVTQGLVRPVQPIERARRILGVIDAAKKSAAKELYTNQIDQVNGFLWDAVPENEKAKLEWVLDTGFARERGFETVEEVWTHWRRIEEDLEFVMAEAVGIDPTRGVSTRKDDLTEFDNLRKAVNIPDNWLPWGATFPGLDEDSVSARANQWQVLVVDEKTQSLADALGIHVEPGMTGEELFAEAQQIIVQREHPIFDVIRPAYDNYISSRANRSGENMLFEVAQSDLVTPEMQDRLHNFMLKNELMQARADSPQSRNFAGQVSFSDQQAMKDEFLFIMNGSKDQKTDWEGIWEEQYERHYGPLDWVPPEPASPFDDNGNISGMTTQPYVRHVVDGDTILIHEYRGSPTMNSVRLLGLRAEEVTGSNQELALEQEEALKDALLQAVEDGDRIYLVRDPRFGNTDRYGRMLAWLWIGDKPWYNPEHLLPSQDPGGDS